MQNPPKCKFDNAIMSHNVVKWTPPGKTVVKPSCCNSVDVKSLEDHLYNKHNLPIIIMNTISKYTIHKTSDIHYHDSIQAHGVFSLGWTGVCCLSLETLTHSKGLFMTEKGTHFGRFFLKYRPIFHNFQVFTWRTPKKFGKRDPCLRIFL